MIADGEGGGGGWARGIEDVEGVWALEDVEVLDEGAVGEHGLCTDACAAGEEMVRLDGGDEFLEGLAEALFAEGAGELCKGHLRVFAEEVPQAWEGESVEGIVEGDVGFGVSFAGEGEHGIGAGFDATVDEASEVDAEEGEGGVGDRVNEVPNEVLGFGGEFVVFAAEGNDAGFWFFACEASDSVGVEAGAVDEKVGLGGVAVFCVEEPAGEAAFDTSDVEVGENGGAVGLDLAGELGDDCGVVNDAFFGDVDSCKAVAVGFNFTDLLGGEPAEAFESVGLAAVEEVLESGDFVLCSSDDDFAADFVGDLVLLAEGGHLADAFNGEAGFEGAGFVVEACVEDAAIVGALVGTRLGLFLEDCDLGGGEAAEERVGGGDANDARADDGEGFGSHVGLGIGVWVFLGFSGDGVGVGVEEEMRDFLGFGQVFPVFLWHLVEHGAGVGAGGIENVSVIDTPGIFGGIGRGDGIAGGAFGEGELGAVPVGAFDGREDGPIHGSETADEERRG